MKDKLKTSYQLSLAAIIIIFNCSNLYGGNSMQAIYSLNKTIMPKLEPKIYSTKKTEIVGILDFPMDNTIATNMLPGTNAVTRINFNDKKLKYKTVAKNFKAYVGGGDTVYTPIFSDEWIGYSQNRGFTLLNIKSGKCRYYSIAGDTNMIIRGVDVIDSDKLIFMFHIHIIPVGGYSQNSNPKQILRIKDLSTSESKTIRETIISSAIDVNYYKGTLFFTDRNIVTAYNLKFEKISHPLTEVMNNEYKRDGEIWYLTIHPELPFAVFGVDAPESYKLYVIRWDLEKNNDDNHSIFNIIEDGLFYQFSYDGKWLLCNSTIEGKKSYIILPVDKDSPHYLGQPIYLGEVPSFPDCVGSSAMTLNPSGLVVSDCTNSDECFLKKWDFTEAEKLIEK